MTSAPPSANGQPGCLRPHSAWIEIKPDVDGRATAIGRRFIASKLTGYDDETFVYDTGIVGSELITNANEAIWRAMASGRTDLLCPIGLTVQCERRWVRLSITDPVPNLPKRCTPTDEDVHGRGLAIVEDLTAMLLVHPHSGGGKTIHAYMALPGVAFTGDLLDRIASDL